MKRIKDGYLDAIEKVVKLSGKNILEIGGGNGSRSIQIAKRCEILTSIEPSSELVTFAKQNNSSSNIRYLVGKAEILGFPDKQFDIAFFTLSLHHVPIQKMREAIDESLRVTKKEGHIIFLEPTEKGTFFEAEIAFDACDGDERMEKRAAYSAMRNHSGYEAVAEILDETVFSFDSVEDFVTSMQPKKNIEKIEDFLKKNDFVLKASRRINIFKV